MNTPNNPHKTITLGKELGKGGEATVYNILQHHSYVAKLYHRSTVQYQTKLRAMVLNPPKQPALYVAIAWPVALLYQQGQHLSAVTDVAPSASPPGQFVGFLMPKIKRGQAIFNIYNPIMRRKLPYPVDRRMLHRTAFNLCVMVQSLHQKGYVIGDINESNILVTPQALVAIVDCDSFQVTDEAGQVHRCQVGKPEFTPPELQGVNLKTVDQRLEHDLFGLGVLLFQLLMEGYHPFAGVLQSQQSVGRVDLYAIRQGLFPYRPGTSISPPPAAPDFQWLHPRLQELFKRCFERGHHQPHLRPSGRQWQDALHLAEQELQPCQWGRHFYSSHLKRCPYCQRTEKKRSPSPPLMADSPPQPIHPAVIVGEILLDFVRLVPNMLWAIIMMILLQIAFFFVLTVI